MDWIQKIIFVDLIRKVLENWIDAVKYENALNSRTRMV